MAVYFQVVDPKFDDMTLPDMSGSGAMFSGKKHGIPFVMGAAIADRPMVNQMEGEGQSTKIEASGFCLPTAVNYICGLSGKS